MRDAPLTGTLLVEIGGTHSRCALCDPEGQPGRITRLDNVDYPDLESVIGAYLDETSARPERAALAVAAPVGDHPVTMTNLGWVVDAARLKNRFGFAGVHVVNDFEALACAVPDLEPDELVTVHRAAGDPDSPVAVLGPGTGLGVSGLVPCGDRWYPIRGEGGHVTLAAADDREAEILRRLRQEYGHISAERALSGPGLLVLYATIAAAPKAGAPDDVTRLAAAGDPEAREALELFFRFLGTVCGDLALTLGARGGVYLGGGILPVLREPFLASGFTARYLDKGRYSGYLEAIPVLLIVAETPALRGLARHPEIGRANEPA